RRARVAALHCCLAAVQPQARGLLPRPMAAQALLGQDGPDGLLEEFDPRGLPAAGRLGLAHPGRAAMAQEPEAHEHDEDAAESTCGDAAGELDGIVWWCHRESLAAVGPSRILHEGD